MSWEYESLFNRLDTGDGEQIDIWHSEPTAVKVGQMGYRTMTTKAGARLEAEVYPIFGRNERGRLRREKKHATRESQERLNEKRAERRLINLIEANFGKGDYHLTLTYAEEVTEAQAKKDIRNYINRIRSARKREGLPEMKYIYAMGGGEEADEKRIHFHIITNGGLNRDEMEATWTKTARSGERNNCDRLQPNERGLEEIARYVFEQHKDRNGGKASGKRRWNPSRNLKKPKVHTSDTKCSNARVKRIAHDIRNEAKANMEKLYPGYRFLECEVYYSDVIDGVYIRCVMRKDEKEAGRKA